MKWRPLAALSTWVCHAAPTSAFLNPITSIATTTSAPPPMMMMAPRSRRSRQYSSSTTRRHPDGTALASTLQPLIEYNTFHTEFSSSLDIASSGIFNADNISVAFSVATFFPQLPWLFLILLPNANVTKKLMGGYGEPEYIAISSLS